MRKKTLLKSVEITIMKLVYVVLIARPLVSRSVVRLSSQRSRVCLCKGKSSFQIRSDFEMKRA